MHGSQLTHVGQRTVPGVYSLLVCVSVCIVCVLRGTQYRASNPVCILSGQLLLLLFLLELPFFFNLLFYCAFAARSSQFEMSTNVSLARDAENRGPAALAVVICVSVVSTLFAAARIFTRGRIMGKVRLDDYLILASVVSSRSQDDVVSSTALIIRQGLNCPWKT